MARPAKRQSDLLDEFLQKAGDFFSERGISPVAGIGFSILVLAGIVAVVVSLQARPPELRALVLSSDEQVGGALVQVFSPGGELLASETAGPDGQISFKKSFDSDKLVIKASKDGFVAADGSRQAIAVVDLGKKKTISLELYPSHVTPGDFNGQVSFSVLDRISGRPVENAVLEVSVEGSPARLTTDSSGIATLAVDSGKTVLVRASAAGHGTEERGFVAIRGQEKISLEPNAPPATSAVQFVGHAPPLLTSDSVLEDALPQSTPPLLPQARVVVTDSSGNALQAGTLKVVSASGQEISSAVVFQGAANLDNLLLSQDYSIKVEGTASGKLEVFAASSPTVPLLSTAIQSGSASLAPTPVYSADGRSQTRLLLSAKSLRGEAVAATFSVQGAGECSGSACALAVPANQLLSVSVSAPGFLPTSVSKTVPAGELLSTSFELVPQARQLEVVFHGARDERGAPVSSLLAGRDYYLVFSLFAPSAETNAFSVRLGVLSHVRDEGFGIADFPAQQGFFSTKSVSYSLQPTCTDLNNNEAVDGLFKWAQLSFEGGGELHKIISVPIHVKPNSLQNRMKVFYRLEGRSGSSVSRVPEDAELSSSTPRKAECYADSLSAELPIVFSTSTPQIPVRPQLAAPTPSPLRACNKANTCISPDKSDEFCNDQFLVVNDCTHCNKLCSRNSLFSCNAGSGSCEPLKCSFPLPGGTPVEQCVEESRPRRCKSVGGVPRIVDESKTCGCAAGSEPDADGKGCVLCPASGCLGQGTACRGPDGLTYSVGSCLPEVFGTQGVATAQPILKCLAGGTFAADIVQCGCPSGFVRSLDNSICVRAAAPVAGASLSGAPVCEGCVSEYTVFFNSAAGKLQATEASIELRADPVFPADAVPLKLDADSSAPFRISVQHFKSSTATEPCYSYDVQKAMLSFKVGGACPVEVHGNKFYHAGLKKEVTSDAVEITIRRESVPPQELVLKINTKFNSISSLLVYPSGVEGSATPQFVFVFNEKQTVFGPRELQVQAQSTQKAEFAGSGAKVLAWRGPGELTVSEKTQQVGFVSYETVASYFSCFDGTGPRAEGGCAGNPFCCAGAWCTKPAFSEMLDAFKQYARATALQTAFRRGNGEPFNTITSGVAPFELHTAAQVIDLAPSAVSALGLPFSTAAECSPTSKPAVFTISASTKDGGKTFSYSASTAPLQQFDYVDGTCGDPALFKSDPLLARPELKAQFLCGFLHGDCSCVQKSESSSTVTQAQNLPGAAQPTDADPNNLANILPQLAEMLRDKLSKMGDQGAGSGQYPPDEAARRQLRDAPTIQSTSFNANRFAEAARNPGQAFMTASQATGRACGASPEFFWVDHSLRTGRFAIPDSEVKDDLTDPQTILKTLSDCENEPGGRDTAAKCEGQDKVPRAVSATRLRITRAIEAALAQCISSCQGDSSCAQGCEQAGTNAQRNFEEKFRGCTEAIGREMSAARACERLSKVEPQTPEPRIGPRSEDWQTLYAFSAHSLPGSTPQEGGGCKPICAGRYAFALRGSRDNTDIVVLRSGVGGNRPGECVDVEARNAEPIRRQTANSIGRFAAGSMSRQPNTMSAPRITAPGSTPVRRMSQQAFPGEVVASTLESKLLSIAFEPGGTARQLATIYGCIPCHASTPDSGLERTLNSLSRAGYAVPTLADLQNRLDQIPPAQRRQANGQPTHLPLDGTAIFTSPELRIIQSEATPEGQAAVQGRSFDPANYLRVDFGAEGGPVARFENPSPDALDAAVREASQGRLPTPPPTVNAPTPLPSLPVPTGITPFQEGGSGFMQVPGDGSEIGRLPPVEVPEKDTPQRLRQKAAESREQEGAPFLTAFQSFRRNPFPSITGMSRFDFTSPLDDRQRADFANTLHDRTASMTGNRRAVLVMTPETQDRFGLSPQDAPVGQVRFYEGRGGGQLGPGGSIVGAPLVGAINGGFVNGRPTPQTVSAANRFVLGR